MSRETLRLSCTCVGRLVAACCCGGMKNSMSRQHCGCILAPREIAKAFRRAAAVTRARSALMPRLRGMHTQQSYAALEQCCSSIVVLVHATSRQLLQTSAESQASTFSVTPGVRARSELPVVTATGVCLHNDSTASHYLHKKRNRTSSEKVRCTTAWQEVPSPC